MQIRTYMSHAYLLITFISLAAAQPSCFYPDGKNATGLAPCFRNADVSHCCRDADVCLTNGLCFSSGLGAVVRRGCTDRTWRSADCPSVCTTETFRSGDAVLTSCGPYNSFCCGQDSAARRCCDAGNSTLTAQVPGGEPMCTRFNDPTASATPNGTRVAGPTCKKDKAPAVIGLAAAFAAVTLAAAALAVYWWMGVARHEREVHRQDQEITSQGKEIQSKSQEILRQSQEIKEMQSRWEMLPSAVRAELEMKAKSAGRTA